MTDFLQGFLIGIGLGVAFCVLGAFIYWLFFLKGGNEEKIEQAMERDNETEFDYNFKRKE